MAVSYDAIESCIEEAKTKDVLVYGNGLGKNNPQHTALLERLIALEIPLLIDGDGHHYLSRLRHKNLKTEHLIITPHSGELEQCLTCASSVVDKDPLKAIDKLAEWFKGVIVYKGPTTIIAQHQQKSFMIDGSEALAKAGSGDVLAGIIAALIGQKLDAYSAAEVGTMLQSKAVQYCLSTLTKESLMATDVIEAIAKTKLDDL